MTKARELIVNSAFDADVVARMGEVFDAAWSKVADHFAGESPSAIGEARTTLAKAVIELAGKGLIEPRALEEAARAALSNAYPHVPPR